MQPPGALESLLQNNHQVCWGPSCKSATTCFGRGHPATQPPKACALCSALPPLVEKGTDTQPPGLCMALVQGYHHVCVNGAGAEQIPGMRSYGSHAICMLEAWQKREERKGGHRTWQTTGRKEGRPQDMANKGRKEGRPQSMANRGKKGRETTRTRHDMRLNREENVS
eukprot:1161332-Pelagomonas_calceolata.AAC.15